MSIETEGCLLNSLLQKKDYLRVRLGPSKSPGISHVLELWPSGSRSSVTRHTSVYSIMKVVHGTIQCGIFNKMPSSLANKGTARAIIVPEEVFKFDAYKGDVIWKSPEW